MKDSAGFIFLGNQFFCKNFVIFYGIVDKTNICFRTLIAKLLKTVV